MSEQVTITPRTGRDRKGDPRPAGAAYPLTALEVVPGNTLIRYGIGADLDTVAFTVYLPLRDESRIENDFGITVRGLECRARVQVWKSGGRGVVAVLASSTTGEEA